MENTFLFPPLKRNLHHITTPATPDPKRLKGTDGEVSFRLLCQESLIGGLIGKSGSVIKQLQEETGSKIRVEEAPKKCVERVVRITGGRAESLGLVRVFERLLEVAGQSGGGLVSCRMLAEGTQVGAVIGKGGKIVDKIRKECGVKIRVSTHNLPACAAATEEIVEIEGDVLAVKKALVAVSFRLQDCQPVSKLWVTGSSPVQPVHQEYFPELSSSIPPQHTLLIPTVPIESVSYASRLPFSLESERVSAVEMKMPQQQVVFKFLCSNERIGGIIGKGGGIVKAIQNETGAAISIGPTTAECDERLITVTALENPENRFSAAQKTVVLLFFRSVEAGFEKGIDSSISMGSSVTAKLVISPSQVGCLLGKGGCIISEMRRLTGVGMKIFGAGQVPKCVQKNDQLMQISGDCTKVKDAIYHVTGRLRDNLFSVVLKPVSVLNETSTYCRSPQKRLADSLWEPSRESLRDPIRDLLQNPIQDAMRDPLRDAYLDPLTDRFREPLRDPMPLSFHSAAGLNRHTSTLTQGFDHLGSSPSLDHLSPPRFWGSQRINGRSIMDVSRGLTFARTGLEHASGSRSVTVTNTTIEIVVPEDVMGSVCGENGRNLARLKEISGAKVIVHEPRLGTSDKIVVISGTPDETQAAQSLLQAFILTGK